MSGFVIRGRVLSFIEDPAVVGAEGAIRYIDDGFVHIQGDRIVATGSAVDAPSDLPTEQMGRGLIVPGLIDPHIHYPQTQVVASYGTRLLDWLERYTFVEERRFADPAHCHRIAGFFLDELFRNGTTSAAVYCTVHRPSAEAFFTEAAARGCRMIAGKVMMDAHAPEGLRDTAEGGYQDSRALIERWHGRGRLGYAITPRFAPTSSRAQLEAAGALAREFPSCWVQTHLSETPEEIQTALARHPWAASYAEIYARTGLLGPRTLLGHCLHLDDGERQLLAETGSVAVACPTSNMFLGSGLFDRDGFLRDGVRTALATDIGGGTSYSMLRTAAAAYEVLQLRQQKLSPFDAFYWITLGNARALGLAHEIGTLEPGTAADITALDSGATPAMAHRMERVNGLDEELFVLMVMGDERAVRATWVNGRRVAGTAAG